MSVSSFVAVQYSSGWIVGSLGSLAGLLSGIKSTHKICEKVAGLRSWSPMEEESCEDVKTVEFQRIS